MGDESVCITKCKEHIEEHASELISGQNKKRKILYHSF